MRGKYPPQKQTALVGIRLGLDDNIIIHSVNNILIPLPMINSVNVKKIDSYCVFLRFVAILQFIIIYYFLR